MVTLRSYNFSKTLVPRNEVVQNFSLPARGQHIPPIRSVKYRSWRVKFSFTTLHRTSELLRTPAFSIILLNLFTFLSFPFNRVSSLSLRSLKYRSTDSWALFAFRKSIISPGSLRRFKYWVTRARLIPYRLARSAWLLTTPVSRSFWGSSLAISAKGICKGCGHLWYTLVGQFQGGSSRV